MSFLPQDYRSPHASDFYLKLVEGENRIRILSQPIFGWEDWHEKKPVRYQMHDKPLKSYDEKKPMRHFWSFIVYNCNEDKIQIMHVTQNSIRKSIEALCKDTDWGDPYHYDIKITKSGSGMDTEYTVNPVPHKPLDENVIDLFNNNPCNLDALFYGGDPFSREWKTYTPLATTITDDDLAASKTVQFSVANVITDDEAKELRQLISECEDKMQDRVWSYIDKLGGKDLSKLKRDAYLKVKPIIIEKRAEYQYSLLKEEEATDAE